MAGPSTEGVAPDKDGFLCDDAFQTLCVEIARRLDGMSVAQVDHVLRTVGNMVRHGSIFSTKHPAYTTPATELMRPLAAGATRQ